MPFYIRVPSLITPVHCITQTEEPQLLQIRELIDQNFLPQIKPKSEEERQQLIKSLQGKYAHAPTSSEDFAQQKQAAIDWEERNR